MDDHPQRQGHLPYPSSRLDHPPHHPHFQAHYRHQQDIHGPLSASVVEGRRAFPFHSSLRSTPLSFSTPAPPSANLSVADILDKYQDANSDFLVSILNAKAKEDEVNWLLFLLFSVYINDLLDLSFLIILLFGGELSCKREPQ